MASGNRHNYEYEVDLQDTSAAAYVVGMVANNARVLEIGAGPGSITKFLKEPKGCHVTALEIDESAIKKLTPYCDKVIQADLNNHAWVAKLQHSNEAEFDVIIAADVLEHVYDPWETLKLAKTLLNDRGSLVISLPHVAHAGVISCLMSNSFDYRDWGLLDRTHIRFFCIKNIQELFEQAGLKIVEAKFVLLHPQESEFANYWNGMPAESKKILLSNPYSQVYQVVVRAVPQNAQGAPLKLMEQPVTINNDSGEARRISLIRRIARLVLSHNVRAKILGFCRVLGIKV